MTSDNYWILFAATGHPLFYLLSRKTRRKRKKT